jgi:hypothetical protein
MEAIKEQIGFNALSPREQAELEVRLASELAEERCGNVQEGATEQLSRVVVQKVADRYFPEEGKTE